MDQAKWVAWSLGIWGAVVTALTAALPAFNAMLVFFFGVDWSIEPSWIAVLMGQGVMPRTHDPLADAMDEEMLRRMLGKLRAHIRAATDSMPSHREFLARHCPAAPV